MACKTSSTDFLSALSDAIKRCKVSQVDGETTKDFDVLKELKKIQRIAKKSKTGGKKKKVTFDLSTTAPSNKKTAVKTQFSKVSPKTGEVKRGRPKKVIEPESKSKKTSSTSVEVKKSVRKCPSRPAKEFNVGDAMEGNDKNIWIVVQHERGGKFVKKWKACILKSSKASSSCSTGKCERDAESPPKAVRKSPASKASENKLGKVEKASGFYWIVDKRKAKNSEEFTQYWRKMTDKKDSHILEKLKSK